MGQSGRWSPWQACASATSVVRVGQCGDAGVELGDVAFGQTLDVGAGAFGVVPQRQQLPDLFERKPEITRAADEAQQMDVAFMVLPVARLRAGTGVEEADAFVMADHLGRHAAGAGDFADVHFSPPAGRQRLSVSALVTTLTLENAIAAPAITGFRKPSAASGMPTTL